jgi:phospholipid/cholesterol/gamma-HCH transport system substrate-binding protein
VRKAIQEHLRDFVAMLVLGVLALGVAGFILSHQRFYLPGWVPLGGTDFFEVKGEFQTAQSIMPGQGQTIDIAGVAVGEIKSVNLVNGRGVITMEVRQKYAKMIHRDASMLLRPKTGLNDMIVELDPGTNSAPRVPDGFTIPIENTLPNVNLDEFFSALDSDTRDYLQLLLSGAGKGLKGQGRALSAVFRRFEPTNRDIKLITQKVAERRRNLGHVIHNFQLLATELGRKDKQIASWVNSSNAVFDSFARQEANLRETVRLLPGALAATKGAVEKADQVAVDLGPAARSLLPGARAFPSSLRESRPLFRQTVAPIRDQIRPFARDAQPAVKALRPANAKLAAITPDLRKTFQVINALLNEWAYNPPGKDESFFFWTAWGAHIGASVFSTQDAQGPIQRGVVMTTCRSLGILDAIKRTDPRVATIIELLNPPTPAQACTVR